MDLSLNLSLTDWGLADWPVTPRSLLVSASPCWDCCRTAMPDFLFPWVLGTKCRPYYTASMFCTELSSLPCNLRSQLLNRSRCHKNSGTKFGVSQPVMKWGRKSYRRPLGVLSKNPWQLAHDAYLWTPLQVPPPSGSWQTSGSGDTVVPVRELPKALVALPSTA